MSKFNVQIVREYIEEVINHKRLHRIFDYCSEDCVFHIPPYVGLGLNFDDRSGEKIVLTDIAPNSPAAGNLKAGDEVVRVTDGAKTWETYKDLRQGTWGRGIIGTPVTVTVQRGDTVMQVPITRGLVDGFDVILSASFDLWRDAALNHWPDLNLEIKVIFGEGDKVACYSVDSGTHKEFHRSAVWAELGIYRLKDGKIVESWAVEDLFSQRRQLGYEINQPTIEPAT